MQTNKYMQRHICMRVYILHKHTYACTRTRRCKIHAHTCIHRHIHAHIHACVHRYTHMHSYMHTCQRLSNGEGAFAVFALGWLIGQRAATFFSCPSSIWSSTSRPSWWTTLPCQAHLAQCWPSTFPRFAPNYTPSLRRYVAGQGEQVPGVRA